MLKLALRNYSKNGKLFVGVFAFTLLGLSLLIPKISIHADPTEGPEPIFSIDYDFNGGTKAGEGTYHTQSVPVGMEFS